MEICDWQVAATGILNRIKEGIQDLFSNLEQPDVIASETLEDILERAISLEEEITFFGMSSEYELFEQNIHEIAYFLAFCRYIKSRAEELYCSLDSPKVFLFTLFRLLFGWVKDGIEYETLRNDMYECVEEVKGFYKLLKREERRMVRDRLKEEKKEIKKIWKEAIIELRKEAKERRLLVY